MQDQTYAQMSSEELRSRLKEFIKEYTDWVGKSFELSPDWEEEINYLSFIRNDIHDVIIEIQARGEKLSTELKQVREIDADWQEWIFEQGKVGELDIARTGKSKNLWWYWVDQLQNLSEEDLKTL